MVHVHADQDSVRLLAVQCCGALARTLSKAECLATVVPVVQRFAQVNCSPQSRGFVAMPFSNICFLEAESTVSCA